LSLPPSDSISATPSFHPKEVQCHQQRGETIQITTKKGEEGKPQITYSNTYGWQNVTNFAKPMNAGEFAEAYDWAQVNSGITPTYSQQQIADYKSGKLQSTNWWGVAMNNSAPQDQQNISFSGGGKNIKYFSSLGYMTQDGLFKTGDLNYKRYNLISNITAQITRNLEAEIDIEGISDKRQSPSFPMFETIAGLWSNIPTTSVYANNNSNYLQNVPDANNPLAVTNSSIVGYNNSYTKSFNGSFSLNYKVPCIDGLKAKFFYAYSLNDSINKTFKKQYTLYDYDASTNTYNPSYNNTPSSLNVTYMEHTRTILDASLDYNKTINNTHHIHGLLLYEKIDNTSDNFGGYRQFTFDAVDQLYAGNSVQVFTSDPNSIYRLDNQAIVGRLNYDYVSKYLFEFNFREDGSSLFPKGKQWGFFPGVLLGWRLSEENFIKHNLPFISNLKLRGSWGKMGDDAAAAFQFIEGYNYPTTQLYNTGYPIGYVFNGNLITGLNSVGMTNPNITWTTATTSDLGIDGNLWNQNLNFTFDVFSRKRTGLLGTLALSLPQTVGASLPQLNINSDLSRGIEISIGTTQHINDFQFGVNAQFSYAHSEWLHYDAASAGNSYLNWRYNFDHRSKNIIWGYKVIGQFQTQSQINSAPIEDGNGNRYIKLGDLMYMDVNHDGIINSLDEVPIAKGNSDMDNQQGPEITYGVSFIFDWKGFDVNALFQGAGNCSVVLEGELNQPFLYGRNGLSQFYNAWHVSNISDPNSQMVSGLYPPARLSGVFDPNTTVLSSYNVKDASYLRLKSLEIGYTLSDQLIKKIGFQKLRVFVNGFNLITWSHIPYMDPEHPQSGAGSLYPITRNLNLGLNVTF